MTSKKKDKNKQKSLKESSNFNFWNLIAIIFLMIFNIAINFNTIDNNDTWWHLKMGEWMVNHHQFYRTEVFSQVTEGKPYVAYEWLSQVLFYFLQDTNGILLSLFKLAIMIFGFASIVWLLAKPYWKGLFTFPTLIVLSYLFAFRAQVRPHLIGEWCTAFLVIGMVYWQKHWDIKKLWWLLPLQILWANCHGSFLLGPGLTFFWACGFWFSQRFKLFPGDQKLSCPPHAATQLFGLSFLLLASSLINPYGFDLLQKSFIMFFTHNYLREYIKEWHSVLEFIGSYWLYFWSAWIVGGWLLLIKNRKEVSFVDFSTLLISTIFPFTGVRTVTLSTVLSFPLMLKFSNLSFPTGYRPKAMVILLLPLIYIAEGLGFPQGPGDHREVGIGFSYKMVPLDIIQHIKSNHLKGVIMNDYDEGAFIIYYLYPDVKTVLDSRTELYGKELFEEHKFANMFYPQYLKYLEKYNVNLAMVRNSNSALRNQLFEDPNWKLEKVGIAFDLFSKVTKDNLKIESQNIELLPNYSIPDQKKNYCIFVRFFGHCLQAPECKVECEYKDKDIAQALQMTDQLCIHFSQACFKKETACGNCRPLCDHYKIAIPQMNKKLGTKYPDSPICN